MAKFRAKYQFHGEQADDLSFQVGDIIWVYDKPANGWWFGRTEDGRQGIFPYNRVEEVPEENDFSLDAFMTPSPEKKKEHPKVAPMIKNDSINDITVKVKKPVVPHGQVFEVKVVLSKGSVSVAGKKMKDFRVLNQALNGLHNSNSEIIGLDRTERVNASIPKWADNIRLTEQFVEGKMKDRASILSDWLSQQIGQNAGDDYLVARWADSKVDFVAPEGAKKDAEAQLNTAAGKVDRMKFEKPRLAITLYKWLKREEQDITLEKNELVALCNESEFNGWYVGEKVNGDKGLFPFNYVKELSAAEQEEILYPDRVPKKKPLPAPKMKAPVPIPTQAPAFGAQFGLGTSADKNVYQPVTETPIFKPSAPKPQNQKPRPRQKVSKYKLSCIEAFDELIDSGVTVEENGKLANFGGRDIPQKGDTVTLYYNGYIWEPQKQELLEFASSDKLEGEKEGGPLVFQLGANLAIDGIEEVAARMSLGQKVRVTLAPEKAYGDVGMPPQIPGNAYLVYDLSLENISRGGSAPQGARNHGGVQRSNVMNRAASSRKQFNNQQYMTPAPNADRDQYKRKLPLAQLQKIVQTRSFNDFGIDPRLIQEYLTEEDFIRTFNIERNKWNFLPVYSQNEMLRNAGLK